MPSYKFKCLSCGHKLRKHLEPGEQKIMRDCPSCGQLMERDIGVPSQQVMETIDNGVMASRVVRLKDVDRLAKDRNKKNG